MTADVQAHTYSPSSSSHYQHYTKINNTANSNTHTVFQDVPAKPSKPVQLHYDYNSCVAVKPVIQASDTATEAPLANVFLTLDELHRGQINLLAKRVRALEEENKMLATEYNTLVQSFSENDIHPYHIVDEILHVGYEDEFYTKRNDEHNLNKQSKHHWKRLLPVKNCHQFTPNETEEKASDINEKKRKRDTELVKPDCMMLFADENLCVVNDKVYATSKCFERNIIPIVSSYEAETGRKPSIKIEGEELKQLKRENVTIAGHARFVSLFDEDFVCYYWAQKANKM
jgi:hypothetical protein